MSNIVVFGATQSGKTTLLGYLATAMLRHPQLNDEILEKLKLIRKLTSTDDFNIGNPYNPVNVNKSVLLPSFVSLDRDELKKFLEEESSEGTTKRIHRKQLTICVSERGQDRSAQDVNKNIPCVFIDIPGFRQRLSDKYRGFYEGDVGVAVLKLSELLELWEIVNNNGTQDDKRQQYLERRLFEPIRIWCDYRSPAKLVIAISQIDRYLDQSIDFNEAWEQRNIHIQSAIDCIHLYSDAFDRNMDIPISPISIRMTSEENYKPHHRMAVFFKREEENVYSPPENRSLPGHGTLIRCLNMVMPSTDSVQNRQFSMASVDKPMRTFVNNSPRTVLSIRALHGSLHQNDRISFGPVYSKESKSFVYTSCDIASLKADGALSTSDTLLEGNVGGVIFSSIQSCDRRTDYRIHYKDKESQISILKSTILFSGDVKEGDIIELEIRKDDYINVNGLVDEIYSELLLSLMPFDQLVLYWFGKKVSVNIVELQFSDDKIELSVIISKIELHMTPAFVLPQRSDNLLKHDENVLFAITHSSKLDNKEIYTYINAAVKNLKRSINYCSVKLRASYEMELDTLFKGVLSFTQRNVDDFFVSYLIPYKDTSKNIDIYSIMTKIRRSIRSYYDRTGYRYLGGVKMQLISTQDALTD